MGSPTMFVVFSAFFLLFSCNHEKPGCSRFRTGKFKYHGAATKQNYVVERNDSTQTELVVETGTVLKFRIEWTEPCTYELQFIGVEKVGNDTSVLSRRFPLIRTTILTMTEDYYVYKAATSLSGAEFSDTMRVVRE